MQIVNVKAYDDEPVTNSPYNNSQFPYFGRNIARRTVHFSMKYNIHPIKSCSAIPNYEVPTTCVYHVSAFFIKVRKGRGYTLVKKYVSLFICFCTKALHLQIVTGLTSEYFILVFVRFVSRRGILSVTCTNRSSIAFTLMATIVKLSSFRHNSYYLCTFSDY